MSTSEQHLAPILTLVGSSPPASADLRVGAAAICGCWRTRSVTSAVSRACDTLDRRGPSWDAA